MLIPKVKNRYKDEYESGDVYIGRGSPYGNPFVLGKDGNRDEVCEKYIKYWFGNPDLQKQTKYLKACNLTCFCAPLRCHGDFLLEMANESTN